MTEQVLNLEYLGASDGHCECCGNRSKRVWGQIGDGVRNIVAVYFISWAEGRPEHDAQWDLILGEWGNETGISARSVASLQYRCGQGFRMSDGRPNYRSIAKHILTRKEVLGTPLADEIFNLTDRIWIGDDRIAEIRDWAN